MAWIKICASKLAQAVSVGLDRRFPVCRTSGVTAREYSNLNQDLRVSKNREFFLMEPEAAYELLESIALISGTQEKVKRVKTVNSAKQQKTRLPSINFTKCNIPVGSELIFVDVPTVKVIVVSDRKVEYQNELTSLSAIAKDIKGYSCAGPSYFTYNGKLVADIAHETQWK